MKSTKLRRLITIGWACALAPLLAEPVGEQALKLVFEPLSLTITKAGGDGLDREGNPSNFFAADAAGGIKPVYKITPDPLSKADLVATGTERIELRRK